MKLCLKLDAELSSEFCGEYAPYYYRYKGFQKAFGENPPTFRANGIYSLFTEYTPVIMKNEILAGNRLGYCIKNPGFEVEYAKNQVDKIKLREFWTNKDHYAPNYEHILSVGVPGIIEEIDKSIEKFSGDKEKCEMLEAMKLSMKGFMQMIKNHASEAEKCLGKEGYCDKRLRFMADNLNAIASGNPKTFAQALQLVLMCHIAFKFEDRNAMAWGRLDQYMYPFYKEDKEKGILSDEQAIELLENAFIKIKNDTVNITIGGMDVSGASQTNELSLCILKAVDGCHVPGPNLSMRVCDSTPDEFLDECLKVIGTGLGYPALMNDNINIASLKAFDYTEEEIYNYSMVGCIENFISGKQPPWTDSRLDTPFYLEYVFNNGVSLSRKSFSIKTGDVESMTSMDDFMKAYEAQLAYGVKESLTEFNSVNDAINQKYFPEPFLSCFCYDCIGRGKDINDGGSIYPSVHGVGLMGVGTVSDSLAAIEKVVFIDKETTLSELRDALNANFEGYEELRGKLLKAPKYGNDDNFVDKYAVWMVDFLWKEFSKHKTRDGGNIYVSTGTNIANVWCGESMGATPDGRKAFEALSDASSPTFGRDVSGPTSALLSVAKPDYTKCAVGSVLNQKYSPEMFSDDNRKKLLALIRGYFKKGGQEIQINATSRKVLEDAMEHPENYRNLVVRVSGFSHFYVTLEKGVQKDILNRTQHS